MLIWLKEIRRPLVDILVGPSGEGLTDADIREEIDTFMFEVINLNPYF